MDLTYSVQWIPTDITFPRRFDVYLDYPFFEHQVTFSLLCTLLILSSVMICSQFHNVHTKCLRSCLFNNFYSKFISFRYCSRFISLLSFSLFVLQIHWFSIFNSFMMVIFLTGLVSMILMRTLRNDYAKYAREDDDLESLVCFLNFYLSQFQNLVRWCYSLGSLSNTIFFIFEVVKPFLTLVLMITGTGCK